MYNNNNNHQQEQQRLLIEEPHPGILKYSTSPILNNTSLRKAYEKNKSNVMRDSKKEKKYFAFMPYGIISLIIILSFTCYIYNNNNNNLIIIIIQIFSKTNMIYKAIDEKS